MAGHKGFYKDTFDANEEEYKKKVGFYDFSQLVHRQDPQPIIIREGRVFRPRCEVMVLDGNKILVDKTNNRGGMGYSLPGGGIEPNESFAASAGRECEEEALVKVKNCFYTGVAWYLTYPEPLWAYYGAMGFVCIGEYDGKYTGYVKKKDRDSFVDNATWEDVDKFKLAVPHKKALKIYRSKGFTGESMVSFESLMREIL